MRFLYGLLSLGLFFNTSFGETNRKDYKGNNSEHIVNITDSKTDVYINLSKIDKNNDGKFDFYQKHVLRSNMYEYFASDDTDLDGFPDHFTRILKEFSGLDGIEHESTAMAYLFLINTPSIKDPRYTAKFSYRECFYLCKSDGKLEKVSTKRSDKEDLIYTSNHESGHVRLDDVNGNKPTEEQLLEFSDFQRSLDNLRKKQEDIEKEIDGGRK